MFPDCCAWLCRHSGASASSRNSTTWFVPTFSSAARTSGEAHPEELTPPVDPVDSLLVELPVQCRLERDGVVAEDERVHVELERHRRASELVDPLHRVLAAGHADLDDAITEGTHVGDDVDVADAGVRRHLLHVLDALGDLREPLTRLQQSCLIAVEPGSLQQALVVRLLLEQVLLPPLEFLLGLGLLPLPLPFLARVLLLLLDPKVVVRGQLELLQAQRVVGLVDRDAHRAAVLDDRLTCPLQPLLRGVDRVGAHGADTVVGLDVVRAQHQVAELANEGRPFLQRSVHHPAGLAADGRPLADRFFDLRAEAVQALLRGQDVVERVPELVVAHLLQEPELVCLDDRFARLAHLPVERRDLLDQRVPAPGQPLQF